MSWKADHGGKGEVMIEERVEAYWWHVEEIALSWLKTVVGDWCLREDVRNGGKNQKGMLFLPPFAANLFKVTLLSSIPKPFLMIPLFRD